MLGSDINDFFETHPVLKRHYKGVFASEQVSKARRRISAKRVEERTTRNFAIINTDTLNGGGKHWWCLAKVEERLGKTGERSMRLP
jgi:hypothetical protein